MYSQQSKRQNEIIRKIKVDLEQFVLVPYASFQKIHSTFFFAELSHIDLFSH
jgi:hypothetical protein